MSRKIKRTVASTLALAMMAGSVNAMPSVQFSSIVQAADAGATVSVKLADASQTTVKPGDTVKVITEVTNNNDGFCALVAWLSYNKKAFQFVSWEQEDKKINKLIEPSQSDDAEAKNKAYTNPDANIGTVVQLYTDSKNYTGDLKFSVVTFKVLDSAADDEYEFTLGGDPVLQDGLKTADQNRYDADKNVVELTPNYVPLKIKVSKDGSQPAETTPAVTTAAPSDSSKPAETTAAQPAETKPAETTAAAVVNPNAIQVGFENITAKAGDTVTINLKAANAGKGFSAMQFDYEMDKSFTFVDSYSEFGNWTIGEVERSLQFLQEKGNNVTAEALEGEDNVIGEIDLEIPAGTPDGVYPIVLKNIEGSVYDTEAKKQQKLTSEAFQAVAGTITIGDAPTTTKPDVTEVKPAQTTAVSAEVTDTPVKAEQPVDSANVAGGIKGPKVDAGKYVVEPGEEFNVQIKVSDNDGGFNGLNAWLDIDTNIFEIIGDVQKGDPSDPNNKKSNASKFTTTNRYHKATAAEGVDTAIAMYSDTKNTTGDMILATVTLKVKDGVKNGYYTLPFDAVAEKGAMGNRIAADKSITILNPTYYGALIQVGKDVATDPKETTAAPVTTPAVQATTPAVTKGEEEQAPGQGINVGFEDIKANAGETVTILLKAKKLGDGFSAMQFDYEMDKTFKFVDSYSEFGNWTIGEVERSLQFLQEKGNNVTADGAAAVDDVIGEFDLEIPEGTPDGKYPITLKNFQGSVYSADAKKQLKLGADGFTGLVGYVIVGEVPDETTAKPAETTAKPAETTPAATTEAKPVETTPAATTAKPAETTPAATTEAKPAETTPAVTTEAEPAGPVKGDVDNNGVVNARDMIALKRFLLLVDAKAPENADVNGDKAINSIDMVHLIKVLLG